MYQFTSFYISHAFRWRSFPNIVTHFPQVVFLTMHINMEHHPIETFAFYWDTWSYCEIFCRLFKYQDVSSDIFGSDMLPSFTKHRLSLCRIKQQQKLETFFCFGVTLSLKVSERMSSCHVFCLQASIVLPSPVLMERCTMRTPSSTENWNPHDRPPKCQFLCS